MHAIQISDFQNEKAKEVTDKLPEISSSAYLTNVKESRNFPDTS